jgi:UDP-N-acetylglucosamine--N-acetylmuramyl-(pentapeptide) pyrophosphoryl-undecaprenol N-acetylglucosamine transferase
MKAINSIDRTKTALILAGGTGGHIFPGLAVAEGLRDQGWKIIWLGAQNGMEYDIAKSNNFAFESIEFSGLRGKGIKAWLFLPFRLLRALWQSAVILHRIKPNIILGFGGYTAFPAGFMGCLFAKPLILHEQNSVPGLSNRVLAHFATQVFTAFPNVIKNAMWIGNPLRSEFYHQLEPSIRFANRKGPLKILVIGGSLGARFLNQIVPQAIDLLPIDLRPHVKHQGGINQIDELIKNYQLVKVEADLTPFIKNTANAFADADLIICRSGASTVTEIAAVGAAALFIPYPSAVDDHQTKNALYLVKNKAGWMLSQQDLTPAKLAEFIQNISRSQLAQISVEAKKMQKENTLQILISACESLIK